MDVLRKILPTVRRPMLYWLDAHWTGEQGTAGEDEQCPLLDELRTINELGSGDDFIFYIMRKVYKKSGFFYFFWILIFVFDEQSC